MEQKQQEYTPLPGESYKEKLQAQNEDMFILRAGHAAKQGLSWERFTHSDENRKFCHLPGVGEAWETRYQRMLQQADEDRRNGTSLFDPKKELEALREERAKGIRERIADKHYQQLRDDLLAKAFVRAPWDQVRRELDLGPDDEPLYLRARKEVGTAHQPDAEDPMTADFLTGFFA